LQSVQPKVSVRIRGLAQCPQPGLEDPSSIKSRVCSPHPRSSSRDNKALVRSHRVPGHRVDGTPASEFVGTVEHLTMPRPVKTARSSSVSSVPEFVSRQLRLVPSKSRVSKPRCIAFVAGKSLTASPKGVLARAFNRIRQTASSSKSQVLRRRFAAPRLPF